MGGQKTAASEPFRLIVAENAQRNIDEITGYVAFIRQEPVNAFKVGDALLETIDKIGKNPFAYRECEELKSPSKAYRRALCLSWVIVYKISGLEIIVLGIIHGSRRPSAIKKLRG